MELCVRTFDRLTADELYDVLQARSAVFVVEQTCPYPDMDGLDRDAVHIFLRDQDGIAAYLRLLRLDGSTAKIGRVLTTRRGQGLGSAILQAGLAEAGKLAGVTEVMLEAQSYAVGFYEKAGFRVTGPEFLEDGIPHREMRKTL